jgi:transcriptional regulator with PAS, ATPase and Fis domain
LFSTISDYCTKDITTLKPTNLIVDAIEVFLKDRIDVVCIVDDEERIIGIVSKYSLFREMLKVTDINLPIESIITHNVITLNIDDSISTAKKTMLNKNIAHGIVIDEKRRVHGIVKKSDIIHGFLHEQELLVSQLNGLIKSLDDAVISIGTDKTILNFNEKSEEIFKLEKDKVLKTNFEKWFPELIDDFQQALQFRYPSKPKQMKIRNHSMIASFIPIIVQDSINSVMVVLQDVTLHEEVATELEYTKRLQNTLNHALAMNYDAIIITDSNAVITFVNDAFFDLFQIPKDKAINQHWNTLIPEISIEKILEGKTSEVEIITISEKPCLVTQVPIIQGNLFLGTITKVIFHNLDEWQDVFIHLEQSESELNELQRETTQITAFNRIVSNNSKMSHIKNQASMAAKGSSTILVTGESGTGKELFAEAIHEESGRVGRFIEINCAAIPADLIESEFFGYTDGAFTGAKKGGKPGKFELAHNGTLFLDEIGDMPLLLQSKLLRVLQEQTFERIGDTVLRTVDVRIIAATNKDLKKMVQEGSFREDLFYRIDIINLNIPPLKERLDDISLLCDHLIHKLNKKMNKNVIGVTSESLAILKNYHWPGNVRQLENVLERAFNLGITQWIKPVHLPDSLNNIHVNLPLPTSISKVYEQEDNPIRLDSFEKELIIETLKNVKNNRSEASRILGISRSTLYHKLRKHGIYQ